MLMKGSCLLSFYSASILEEPRGASAIHHVFHKTVAGHFLLVTAQLHECRHSSHAYPFVVFLLEKLIHTCQIGIA